MRNSYDASSRADQQKKASVIGKVHLWLRAGHAKFFRHDLEDRLGPWGINIDDFINKFDAQSRQIAGAPVPVVVTIYDDETYEFEFGRISHVKPPLSPEAMDPFRHS